VILTIVSPLEADVRETKAIEHTNPHLMERFDLFGMIHFRL
jgi:hypothetical protein